MFGCFLFIFIKLGFWGGLSSRSLDFWPHPSVPLDKLLTGLFHCGYIFSLSRHCGSTAKLGPWVSRYSWASVKGLLDRFLTNGLVVVVVVVLFGDRVDITAPSENLSSHCLSCHLHFDGTISEI